MKTKPKREKNRYGAVSTNVKTTTPQKWYECFKEKEKRKLIYFWKTHCTYVNE